MRYGLKASSGYRNGNAVENFITAAIISARESYCDPRWLFWAENWIAGRDRSYESAELAHRQARLADMQTKCAQGMLGEGHQTKEPIETLSDETAAERAAWAAGLALINAPMAPDLTGFFLRFEARVKDLLAGMLSGRALPWRAPVMVRWMSLARGA
jgi:hypothetical protein